MRAIFVVALLGFSIALAQTTPSKESAIMSDRIQRGLRGPVKSCTERSTLPGVPNAEGTSSEIRSAVTTTYDPEGRLLSTRNSNSNGPDWITRNEYSPSGQLLRIASGVEGQTLTETNYSYDQEGRLQKITPSDQNETPVLFSYDEHGRKTTIVTSRPEDYRPNMATGIEVMEERPNLPGGGTATTIYDEHDRPTEVQIRDASGGLIRRTLRTYDPQGHVLEQKQSLDNLDMMFPPEVKAKLLEESGVSEDELRQQLHAQITKLMGGQSEAYSIKNRYDSEGRKIHTSQRIFSHQSEIETTYNEHGDVESEITRSTRPDSENDQTAQAPPLSEYSEVHYSYQYDQHGNWIERTVSYRSSPNGEFQRPSTTQRSLTYY